MRFPLLSYNRRHCSEPVFASSILPVLVVQVFVVPVFVLQLLLGARTSLYWLSGLVI